MKAFLYIFLIIGGIFIISNVSYAQTAPQFIITWRARSFAPADYLGKIFPTKDSSVEIGFDVVVNGKIVDLSKKQIKWTPYGLPYQSGSGLKKITIVPGESNKDQVIKITIPQYNSAGELTTTIAIPVVSPEIIIDSASYKSEIKIGKNTIFKALPFFFNVNSLFNLSFNWFLGGTQIAQKTAGQPDIFNLNLATQGQTYQNNINISTSVQNRDNSLESASKSLDLTIIQ